MKASIVKWAHLGDKIVACIILWNLARKIGQEIEVCGDEVVSCLISDLNLEGLVAGEFDSKSLPSELSIGEFFDFSKKCGLPFFSSKIMKIDFNPAFELKDIELPKFDCLKKDLTLFQFDSRSTGDFKKNLSRLECNYMIKKYARHRPVGIGGEDTRKKLPYEYKLGNLQLIIKELMSARQFVGIDSGMSHLAGVLGVPSVLRLIHTSRDVMTVERFYNFFYSNVVCLHDFGSPRKPSIKIF